MTIFKKIKADLDERIAEDEVNQGQNQKFAWRHILDGRILTRKGFLKFFGVVFLLSVLYMGNRYKYENLLRERTNLNMELQRVECKKLLLIEQFTQISTRDAIIQKLQDNNIPLSNDGGKIIKIK